MELRQLECFLAIVEMGGIKEATSQLHVTQPAISYQLHKLEHDLGTTLFHRRPGGMSLTEAGRTLSVHAKRIFSAVERTEIAVRGLEDGTTDLLRIGVESNTALGFLPFAIKTFHERWPRVRFSIHHGSFEEIIADLLGHEISVAVVTNCAINPDLVREVLFKPSLSTVSGKRNDVVSGSHARAASLAKEDSLVFLVTQQPLSTRLALTALIEEFRKQSALWEDQSRRRCDGTSHESPQIRRRSHRESVAASVGA